MPELEYDAWPWVVVKAALMAMADMDEYINIEQTKRVTLQALCTTRVSYDAVTN